MTSIVIPLGTGSRWNDTELRFCLRSVEKHLTGYGEVFIVGEKPPWLRNVVHIPCPDYGDKIYDKERNIYCKILAACADDRVTEDFLFMNDDHFLLQDYNAELFPNYFDGFLKDFKTITLYRRSVSNTIEHFNKYALAWLPNFEPLYCDVHCPILYNKQSWKGLQRLLDMSKPFGYCLKTIYGMYELVDEEWIQQSDLKINEVYPASKIRDMIYERPWFSIGDRAREGGLLKVLQELYPHKSQYE